MRPEVRPPEAACGSIETVGSAGFTNDREWFGLFGTKAFSWIEDAKLDTRSQRIL